MQIAGRNIGLDHEPFVIAELSGNHNQSLDRALALVDAAADAGVHAVKFQTFRPDGMTLDMPGPAFEATPTSPWAGRRLHGLYGESHLPWEWHAALFDRARERGLIPFSSPFHTEAVDFLESLDCPAYKIASFELTDLPLIRTAARTGKPMIMSTGMATLVEIAEALDAARDAGATDVTLLRCTSAYPSNPRDANLRAIPAMRQVFGCEVGLSDHTLGVGTAVASVALGASVIEKHITIARADGGVDSAFSLEPHEFRQLVDESRNAWLALGQVTFGPTAAERGSVKRRRSILARRDIAPGEPLTLDNVAVLRPAIGLAPKHLPVLLGRRAARAIAMGEGIQWDAITSA